MSNLYESWWYNKCSNSNKYTWVKTCLYTRVVFIYLSIVKTIVFILYIYTRVKTWIFLESFLNLGVYSIFANVAI